MTDPPGNSLAHDQQARVSEPGGDLATDLRALLERIGEEIAYNEMKGTAPYRLGMHDGLRFAEDAIAALLVRHGFHGEAMPRASDA